MLKMLSRCAAIFVATAAMSACAMQSSDGGSDPTIAEAHQTLSTASTPKGLYPLHAEAVQLADGRVIVDLAITNIEQPVTSAEEPGLHDTGEFLAVMVYIDRAGGKRDVIEVLTPKDYYGPNSIGPGGGCIHFFVPAKLGDQLFIGGVVKLAGQTRAQIGAAPSAVVVNQIPPNDYQQWPFAALPDHTLPPP